MHADCAPSRRGVLRALLALTLGAFVLVASAPGARAADSCSNNFSPGGHLFELTVQGAHRWSLLHVPSGIRAGERVPLLLVLHGAGGTGSRMQRYTGFSRIANRYKFIVAYPSADGAFWNRTQAASKPNDVEFLSDLISYVESNTCVNPARVFATGVSNGGEMVAVAGCTLSSQIAGIAPVAGGTDDLSGCHPSEPVSLLDIHGTADQVVPYFGSSGRRTRDGLPPFVNGWVALQGCSPRATAQTIAKRTTLFRWHGCASGVRVAHIRIQGGRHQWPGATPPDPGPPATICASCTIWSFFSGLKTSTRRWSGTGGAGLS